MIVLILRNLFVSNVLKAKKDATSTKIKLVKIVILFCQAINATKLIFYIQNVMNVKLVKKIVIQIKQQLVMIVLRLGSTYAIKRISLTHSVLFARKTSLDAMSIERKHVMIAWLHRSTFVIKVMSKIQCAENVKKASQGATSIAKKLVQIASQ